MSLGAFRWSLEKSLMSESEEVECLSLSSSSSSKTRILFALNRVSYCLVSKIERRRVRFVSTPMKLRMSRCSWYRMANFSRSFTLLFLPQHLYTWHSVSQKPVLTPLTSYISWMRLITSPEFRIPCPLTSLSPMGGSFIRFWLLFLCFFGFFTGISERRDTSNIFGV